VNNSTSTGTSVGGFRLGSVLRAIRDKTQAKMTTRKKKTPKFFTLHQSLSGLQFQTQHGDVSHP
jgi:hypothetical protein